MSRKPLPVLHDMPTHLKERIAEKVERYTDKMALRSFNSDFRKLIDDPEGHIEHLCFCCFKDSIVIQFQSEEFFYRPWKSGCRITKDWNSKEHLVKDQDYVQVALRDFKAYVDNPNVTIKRFILEVCKNHAILSELVPKGLKVECFGARYFGRQEDIVPVLSQLDVDVLKSLGLHNYHDQAVKPEFDELVKLDQWKNVKTLELCDVTIPAEHWWNKPYISLESNFILDQLPALIDHFRQCPDFQQFTLFTSAGPSRIKKVIGEHLQWATSTGQCFLTFPATNNQSAVEIMINKDRYLVVQKYR